MVERALKKLQFFPHLTLVILYIIVSILTEIEFAMSNTNYEIHLTNSYSSTEMYQKLPNYQHLWKTSDIELSSCKSTYLKCY